MSQRFRAPSAYELAALAIAVLALGGVGYAAIPAADGTIKACYATTNGLLLGIPHSKGDVRIVDEGAGCRSYEKAVNWNQQGAPGLAGYQIVESEGAEDSNQLKQQIAECPAGKKVIGGGGGPAAAAGSAQRPIIRSEPFGDDRWGVVVSDLQPGGAWSLRAVAICAAVTP